MKISQTTFDILKNFTTINPSILIKEGSVIRTKNITSTIMGEATVTETFPRDFGIYDLSQFLSALSLFSDPDLEFGDTSVKVTSGKSTLNYIYSDPTMIVSPTKGLTPPSNDVELKLSSEVLQKLIKAVNILQAPEVALQGKGGEINFRSYDDSKKNTFTNDFLINVGETTKDFTVVFKVENLIKMLVRDYDVVVSSVGMTKFISGDLSYVIAIEKSSTF